MKTIRSLRLMNPQLNKEDGSITAETAVSIMFIVVAVFAALNVLLFAIQYHRLLALAQESSRVAASMEEPQILENKITEFITNIDPDINVDFLWREDQVEVTLTEPTGPFVKLIRENLSVDASAPRWTN